MTTPLQAASQAVIARWDAPSWKDQPHTAGYIAELRKALDAEIAQSVEPVLYQRRMKADWSHQWTAWGDCSDETFKQVLRVPSLHDWTYQARALYLHPPQPQATTPVLRECRYESNELKVCRKCGQLHDKAIAAQGEKP